MDRQQIFRNKEYAEKIAEETGGFFLDTEFKDQWGSYWIVIWRDEHV